MKSKKIFLLIFVIAGLGAFVLINDPSPSNPANTGSKEKEKKDMAENTTSSNSVVVIDFPLLAEARPKDLIDMSLAFPDELQKLDGKKVSLIAFMAPFDSLEDMSRCMMVPSYVGCTFCTPPNLRQVVFVTQGNKDDETVYSFIEEPSHVTGTFRITRPDSTHEGKEQGFVYSIENAEVVPHTGEAPVRAAGHVTSVVFTAKTGTYPAAFSALRLSSASSALRLSASSASALSFSSFASISRVTSSRL